MATTTTTAKTTCGNCGAEIPRPDLSLCPYCATPLALGKEAPERTQTMERLLRMEQHPDYPAALAQEPPDEPEREQGRQAVKAGALVTLVGAVFLAVGGVSGDFVGVLPILGGLLLVAGLWRVARGLAESRRFVAGPVLKRPALVTDRRSETELGFWVGKTVYYFALEFADGSSGEFRQPGRGTREDPLVAGRTGVAYTRGQQLLGFKFIKV
jgi:hypothetical protein